MVGSTSACRVGPYYSMGRPAILEARVQPLPLEGAPSIRPFDAFLGFTWKGEAGSNQAERANRFASLTALRMHVPMRACLETSFSECRQGAGCPALLKGLNGTPAIMLSQADENPSVDEVWLGCMK